MADVNVWLAAAVVGHTHQKAAQSWFDWEEAGTISFCRMTLTGPAAWRIYDGLFDDSRVRFAMEAAGIEDQWRQQTAGHGSGPNLWTDAYLAAFASTADLTVVTFDKAFARRRGAVVHVLS